MTLPERPALLIAPLCSGQLTRCAFGMRPTIGRRNNSGCGNVRPHGGDAERFPLGLVRAKNIVVTGVNILNTKTRNAERRATLSSPKRKPP